MSKDLHQVPAFVVASEVALLAQIACGYVPGRTAIVTRFGDDVTVQSLDCGDYSPVVHVVSAAEWSRALRVCSAGAVDTSERVVKSAIHQGLAANANRVLYARRPNGSTCPIPVEERDVVINALGALWAREAPLQNWLGITLDPDGQIGVDTLELCHFPR